MKRYIILILAAIHLPAVAQEVVKEKKRWVVAEAGVRMPLGKLADKIAPSPEFGLWYRRKLENNDMMDLGLSLYVPLKPHRFDYVAPDSLYRVKAKGVSGMAGVRFNKIYSLPGRYNKSIEWVSSFGYAFFTYHDTPAEYSHENFPERYNNEEHKINTYTKSFSTFHIGQGIKFQFNGFGIQAHYNYAPYGIFSDHVPKDFGSHSLSLSLTYKP